MAHFARSPNPDALIAESTILPERSLNSTLLPVSDARGNTLDATITASQASFANTLSRQSTQHLSQSEQATESARQLVSVALVQPVLKHMRENSHAAAPFAPNQAERTFRGMMDASFAQHIVTGGHWGLVDSVARKLLSPRASSNAAEPQVDETVTRKDSALARE